MLDTKVKACFYVGITRNFERFQYFNFETNFLKNENIFQKNWAQFFSWNYKDWKRNIAI